MRFIIMIACVGLFNPVAFGTVVIVQPEQSIQTAVNVAAERDTVIIHDGTYIENIVVWKTLTISSLFLLDGDTNHIGQTVVRAGTQRPDTGSCFVYANSQARFGRLVGLTLTGGTGTITSDAQAHGGGGVYVWRSGVSVEYCNFLRTMAEFGGGLYVEGNIITQVREASVVVSDCRFDSCNVYNQGGGIWAGACSLTVASCAFIGNIAPGGAAGAVVVGSVSNFDACTFVNGVSSGDAGGLVYLDNPHGRIVGCLFDQTDTYATACLNFDRSLAPIIGCTFRGVNSATAAYIQSNGTPLVFTHNIVQGNTSSTASTGSIIISNGSAEISHNRFIDNWNNNGGALTVQGYVTANIHNNVFTGNQEQNHQYGSAIMAWSLTAAEVWNNRFIGNSGNCIYFESSRLDSLDARNNYWGDHSGPFELLHNPSGLGDTLMIDTTRGKRVIYYPYLGAPPDTTVRASPPRFGADRRWQLDNVYPNPFNAIATIHFTLKHDALVHLTIYNQLGQQTVTLVDRVMVAGTYQESWDARGLASGVYFIRLEAGLPLSVAPFS